LLSAGAVTPPSSPLALLVSRNSQTLHELRAYFDQRGVGVELSEEIDIAGPLERFTAFVLFPDEFPQQRAVDAVRALALELPRAPIVVVSRYPARFESIRSALSEQAAQRFHVLPRPVWGFALLDRILDAP
jgi:hypothetical protein